MRIEFMIERKKELGLTNATLAKKAGLPLTTTAKIMAGIIKDPKLHTLQSLAKALNCTIDDFYEPSDSANPLPQNINVDLTNALTPHEQAVIEAYRAQPEMQAAVDRLLGVPSEQKISADTTDEEALAQYLRYQSNLNIKSKS
jgi:transcriptional regulator with XRE-family HTH domain